MAYVTYDRPKIITVICIIGYLLVILGMPAVFSPDTRKMGDFFPALFALLIALRFIAYVGLWHMKRWGVEMLMLTFAASIAEGIIRDSLNPVSIVYHLGVITFLIFQYKKMDRNL